MKVLEDAQLEVKRKLPWVIDVLLYPANLHGIIQIAIFYFLSLIINLLDRFVFSYAKHYGGILSVFLYVLLIGYIFYYLAYCVFDSSKGSYRAPDISTQNIPDRGDLISQIFLMLGCVAICFWPIAVYYIFTKRTDLIFWVLAGCGIFFFPMALLRGVLFDASDALNPILIISSIFRTFLPYCGLILLICGLSGFVAIILPRLPVWGVISNAIKLYLLFVAAHLLGSFYWWHKDKLDWGI